MPGRPGPGAQAAPRGAVLLHAPAERCTPPAECLPAPARAAHAPPPGQPPSCRSPVLPSSGTSIHAARSPPRNVAPSRLRAWQKVERDNAVQQCGVLAHQPVALTPAAHLKGTQAWHAQQQPYSSPYPWAAPPPALPLPLAPPLPRVPPPPRPPWAGSAAAWPLGRPRAQPTRASQVPGTPGWLGRRAAPAQQPVGGAGGRPGARAGRHGCAGLWAGWRSTAPVHRPWSKVGGPHSRLPVLPVTPAGA